MNRDSALNLLVKAAALLLAALAVYYPSIHAGFIWDDDTFYTRNPIMMAPDALRRFWFTTEPPDYFPLVSTTLWIQKELWGFSPLAGHLVNMAFHALNALIFWRVLARAEIPAAWTSAMVFALHPVQVEAVSWITQIKTVQSAFFYLLALRYYLASCRNGCARDYAFSLCLFLLALLSKTSVVMLPVLLLLYHAWKGDLPFMRSLLRTAPYFLLSLVLGLVTVWYQYNRAGAQGAGWSIGFAERLANAGHIPLFYLYKLLLPLDLAFVYPRWSLDPSAIASWLPHAALLATLAVLAGKWNSWGRHALMGLGYFTITLFPVMGFLNIYFFLYSFVADHYQYIASQGAIALACAGVHRGASRTISNPRPVLIALAGLALTALFALTWKQQGIYQDKNVLWQDTLAKNPQAWIAHNNLGIESEAEGDLARAERHYRETLRINPRYAEAEDNLGLLLLKTGRAAESREHFLRAIHLKPDFWQPHNNLGTALANEGEFAEAEKHFRAAITIDPENAGAHNNLGLILEQSGRRDEAMKHWQQALHDPAYRPQVLNNIGSMLIDMGKSAEAVEYLREAVAADPSFAMARSNLDRAFKSSGAAR